VGLRQGRQRAAICEHSRLQTRVSWRAVRFGLAACEVIKHAGGLWRRAWPQGHESAVQACACALQVYWCSRCAGVGCAGDGLVLPCQLVLVLA
jgi:hypothetical protein